MVDPKRSLKTSAALLGGHRPAAARGPVGDPPNTGGSGKERAAPPASAPAILSLGAPAGPAPVFATRAMISVDAHGVMLISYLAPTLAAGATDFAMTPALALAIPLDLAVPIAELMLSKRQEFLDAKAKAEGAA